MKNRKEVIELIRLRLELDLKILEEKASILVGLSGVEDADWNQEHTEILRHLSQSE